MNDYILHLENPGENWENCSPIGNGSCGMMISGGIGRTDIADLVLIGGLGLGGGIGALLKWLDDRKSNNAINLEEDKDNG